MINISVKSIGLKELQEMIDSWDSKERVEDLEEIYLNMKEDLGRGFIYALKIRQGITLGIHDYILREKIKTTVFSPDPLFYINFAVSGRSLCYFIRKDGSSEEYILGDHNISIFYRPTSQLDSYFEDNIIMKSVTISVEPAILRSFLIELGLVSCSVLRSIFEGAYSKEYKKQLRMTFTIRHIIYEIINCSYVGGGKRLWLEAKTLELLSHILVQIGENKENLDPIKLRKDEILSIMKMKDILVDNLIKPPSLSELSRLAGINKNKLNQGFRELYGISAFEFLRYKRLERGKELLLNKEKNIAEISAEIGYAQQCNFTKAFKKQFGVNPKKYRRE